MVSYCPHCGQAAQEGASYCVACGTRLTAPLESAPAREWQGPPPPLPEYPIAAPNTGVPAAAPMPGWAAGDSPSLAAAQGRLVSWSGQPLPPNFAERRVIAGILGIVFGQLGIHKFVLGYVGAGIAMLSITVVSYVLTVLIIGLFGVLATTLIGLIEGIIYLSRSDDEFIMRYGVNRRSWF